MMTQGLRVWFRDEIENTVLAVDRANLDIAQHIPTEQMHLYRAGFEAAVDAILGAFGIAYRRPVRQVDAGREVEQ